LSEAKPVNWLLSPIGDIGPLVGVEVPDVDLDVEALITLHTLHEAPPTGILEILPRLVDVRAEEC
jgi:hypothetical protein